MTDHVWPEEWTTEEREKFLEQLIDIYAKPITNFAYTYVKDWGTAEDIAQDVFIKVNEHLDTFRQEASLQTWIYQIAANRSKDILRKKYFKTTFVTDLVEKMILKRDEHTPEKHVMQITEGEELAQMVLDLPVKFREVIILYYYHDLSTTAISQFLNINAATVKSRLQRGRHRLKDILLEEKIHE
ncbi:RNA polymerase sigma-70 factor [Halalkalibacter wakoensis JCM 9140]|uniref:RNA polymerase sigma-70 factor n=1 Tax=Halalkalibacter wakoensis JCM 9140 TaxID=1236970 RepID=W4Q3F8_9BACI|nr:sigma-70 family RNA polymerase sigma factor [Halalkalibacter wakoensis]GAE26470.1 RNA polymerase sigma-70 factor [Halalkalibacter wakoensis JCM 9140]